MNGEEIDEFIREALALRYLTSYEVNTVSPKVQYDRKELIRIFDEANTMLRGEGLRAGIERFGEFANILFLKLISESEQIKRESGIQTKFDIACSWDSIKQIPSSTRIEYLNKTVYEKLNALSGQEKDFKIDEPESIFAYSLMPESDIAKIFRIINLDDSQISNVGGCVKTRNNMAHASGKFEILNEESFDTQVHAIYISIRNIHNQMDGCIRKWYKKVLLDFCEGKYEDYDNPKDVILEQMIQSFELSVNELLVCNEMSVSSLNTVHKDYQTKLKDFKKAVFDYCQEMGYIS